VEESVVTYTLAALIGGGAEPRTDGCRIGDVRHGSTKRVASSVVLTPNALATSASGPRWRQRAEQTA
jgi:hypothetical protein